jgi:myotubularin-related protein 6/7/8
MVGVRQNRSIQDEKLLAAIFSTTRAERPLSQIALTPPEREDSSLTKESDPTSLDGDLQRPNAEAIEDAMISKLRSDNDEGDEKDDAKPLVYGAQQRNMIVDARPTVNAYAMQAVGLGSENMDHYKFATKVYLGIDNIHVMRDSLNKVVEALKDSDVTPLGPNKELLHKSHWLKHIANVLDGVGLITRQVGLQHSHVLIHCSDGWDRTSQLSALSQVCLDPYYRTLEGFIVLVEKDWLAFGHMFRYRSGFLSSEKWFQIENERIGGNTPDSDRPKNAGNEAIVGAQKTFENALLSAKGFFSNKHYNDSRESVNIDSEGEQIPNYDSDAPGASKRIVSGSGAGSKAATADKPVTKVKETAPIFHQFLDATYQLMYQYPSRFEFSERFLRRLLYHLYSCQYGTFLFDNEKERVEAKASERTRSVWDYFLSRREQFLNPNYDPIIDDNVRGRERLIFPRTDEVRWWNELFARTDEEMNGRPIKMQVNGSGAGSMDGEMSSLSQSTPGTQTPVLISMETGEERVSVTADIGNGLKAASSESAIGRKGRHVDGSSDLPERRGKDMTQVAAQPQSQPRPAHVAEDPLDGLADDLDPLGIGEVKDRATIRKTQGRLREQLEVLMQ